MMWMTDLNRIISRIFVALLGLSASLYSYPTWAATYRTGKTVAAIQGDTSACMYFTLDGVAEADPVKPGTPYFAVPLNNPNVQLIESILLTARATGRTVYVRTDGTLSCSYATTFLVGLDP